MTKFYHPAEATALGIGDLHLPIGWGDIPWEEIFSELTFLPDTTLDHGNYRETGFATEQADSLARALKLVDLVEQPPAGRVRFAGRGGCSAATPDLSSDGERFDRGIDRVGYVYLQQCRVAGEARGLGRAGEDVGDDRLPQRELDGGGGKWEWRWLRRSCCMARTRARTSSEAGP